MISKTRDGAEYSDFSVDAAARPHNLAVAPTTIDDRTFMRVNMDLRLFRAFDLI